jgi:hypothetical protein
MDRLIPKKVFTSLKIALWYAYAVTENAARRGESVSRTSEN